MAKTRDGAGTGPGPGGPLMPGHGLSSTTVLLATPSTLKSHPESEFWMGLVVAALTMVVARAGEGRGETYPPFSL